MLLMAIAIARPAAAQGVLTNGANHQGSISAPFEVDVWTFDANQGDAIVLSIGEVPRSPDPTFWPWLRVTGPTGATLVCGNCWGDKATQMQATAPLTGTYTVLVASAPLSGSDDAVGDYVLRLAKAPGPFTVDTGDQGGPLTNGANHPGHIDVGEVDMWSFTANQGDAILLSIGEVPVPPNQLDPGFWPWLRLFRPDGSVLVCGNCWGDKATQMQTTAPLTGTYTVVVASAPLSGSHDRSGDYLLRLAKAPGSFTVEPGDQGGPLTNGANHAGRIEVGEMDMWSFTANQGDALLLSLAEIPVPPTQLDPGFWPWLRLFRPDGSVLVCGNCWGDKATQMQTTAPLTGTYTVVVASAPLSGAHDSAGDYVVRLAKAPGPFTVDPGDHGGAMTNNTDYVGRIETGDLDMWSFHAAQGSRLTLTLSEIPVPAGTPDPGFWPWLRLVGPTGATVVCGNCWGNTGTQASVTAPLTGTYTVVVASAPLSGANDAAGDYKLKVIGATSPPPPPTSLDDPSFTTVKDTPLVVSAPGVMANDINVAGATVAVVTGVTTGVLSLNPNGGFTYTPPAGFTGPVTFTYRATNAAGPGNTATVTISVTATPVVQPPTSLYASNITGNTVTLRWTPPASGLPPTGYVLEGGVLPGAPLVAIPTGSANPIFVFTVPNGSFYVRMKTASNGLLSGPSNEIRIHANVPVPPSAPFGLTGMVNGSAVALSWRNTFAGGAPQNVILDVSGTLSGSINLGNVESFAFPSIPAGNYTFSVRAANAGGVSPSSNAVTMSFPNTCAPPQAPEHFLAYKSGNVLHLLWDPPSAGDAPTHFLLNVSGAINLSVPLPTRGITAPVPPGSYTFSVAAVNACGTSPATPAQTVVIP